MTDCTVNCSANFAASPAGPVANLTSTVRQWLRDQRLKARIRYERAQLANMSEAMLRDIGIDRASAEQEAQRSDIPANRRI